MAYQNVGTPRLYINVLEYLDGLGILSGSLKSQKMHYLDPASIHNWGGEGNIDTKYVTTSNVSIGDFFTDKSFLAILGHNFKTADAFMRVQAFESGANPSNYSSSFPFQTLINGLNQTENTFYFEADGFTMSTFDGGVIPDEMDSINFRLDGSGGSYDFPPQANSIFLGTYYDMPHSPDLNLTLSYEYDGVKTQQTKGGATLSNASYVKPADWGNQGAWQLGENTTNLRTGRRSWSLQFSYLNDSDVFPDNAGNSYSSGGSADDFTTNIATGTDFFSQVVNRTMGGHLPFIFQPDKDNNNPDQFAICRFDMDTFSYKQVANNVYNISLKIREVW